MWRGTLLHEILNLPPYWRQVAAAPQLTFPVERLSYGAHPRQYLLLAHPAGKPKAWIFYWHGGGWQFGTPEQFTATAQSFLAADYGVVLPSYRRLPRYRFAAIREDTISMLAACRRYWDDREEATQKIILLGMSAGGHLATLVGLDPTITETAGWQKEQIIGVVTCGGVVDFSVMKNNLQVRMLAGSSSSSAFQQANPAAHLGYESPPVLLIHGTKDGMVPYAAAQRFVQQYQQRSKPDQCELITLPNGSHLDAARWMFQPDSQLSKRVFDRINEWQMS